MHPHTLQLIDYVMMGSSKTTTVKGFYNCLLSKYINSVVKRAINDLGILEVSIG